MLTQAMLKGLKRKKRVAEEWNAENKMRKVVTDASDCIETYYSMWYEIES